MSRLDSFIRRMCAQRDILNSLVPVLQDIDGDLLEFGLGSGRTLDHLRHCFPARRIILFEREIRDDCLPEPPPDEIVPGDIRDTSLRLPDGCAALVHADIDTGRASRDQDLAGWLPALVARVLTPGGVVASSFPLSHAKLDEMPLPPSVSRERYFLARRTP